MAAKHRNEIRGPSRRESRETGSERERERENGRRREMRERERKGG